VKRVDDSPPAISMGELRAEWREQHLCLRCSHHAVCKMASGLDANFLVVISRCLAFEPAEADAPDRGERR
jgi:hypothetical protein